LDDLNQCLATEQPIEVGGAGQLMPAGPVAFRVSDSIDHRAS
jgi:hypothetical protein